MSTENMNDIKENETEEKKNDTLEVYGISADTPLGDILQNKPEVIPILMDAGMHCISCPAAMMETLGEAAIVHGIPIDELLEFIKESLDRENAEKE